MGVTERRNVIVVGAGASKEFELPTGKELKSLIAKTADIEFEDGYRLITGNHEIVDTLKVLANSKNPSSNDINRYLHAAWQIRDNMPLAPSIDNFIDTHRDNVDLVEFGKIAIAHSIL
jgi:hypothetical protein